jgi:hypothetical protein
MSLREESLRHGPAIIADRRQASGGLLTLVVVRVDLDIFLPLRWDGALLEDGGHWTSRFARAAVDAFLGVDIEHVNGLEFGFALRRVNAVYRTHIHAGSIFDTDTGLRDHIRHGKALLTA